MNSQYQLSVVIAVQHAQANLPVIMHALDPANHNNVEFLFPYTDADPDTEMLVSGFRNVRVLVMSKHSLIPHLWRDGIKQAQADKVALGTAHCIPADDWVKCLLDADMSETPGIGGILENDETSTARDWAIYLLRYISFAPPQIKREVREIAADNALYRRKDILEHTDLLEKGFWEPSFHARFRKAGMKLELDPGLRVVHRNQYSAGQFFIQRLAHGKEFALARVREISTAKRLLLIILSPALPSLFMKKIISAVIENGRYESKLLIAFPWLTYFLFAWGLGEAMGYLLKGNKK